MKINVWYPDNTASAWSCSTGVADELERMGHQVAHTRLLPAPARNKLPEISELLGFDLILMLGMEHYVPVINGCYGSDGWKKVKPRKIAWYHESAFREDRNPITSETLAWADEHFFPAAQDAEFFDQEHFVKGRSFWLPFGVDDHMFNPIPNPGFLDGRYAIKLYETAFIGMVYPKRASFLGRLSRHLDESSVFEVGKVVMQDLSGTLMRAQTKLYADNLRQIKVFCNLPALSQHQVTKVFEVLASGTFLLTPALEGAAALNMKLFKHKEHLMYYPENHLGYLAQLLREWPSKEKDDERIKIAQAGYEEVKSKHTLRHRLDELFGVIGREKEPQAEKVEAT